MGGEYRDNFEIGFEGIQVVLAQKRKTPDKVILDGSIAGKACPGRMVSLSSYIFIHKLSHPT